MGKGAERRAHAFSFGAAFSVGFAALSPPYDLMPNYDAASASA